MPPFIVASNMASLLPPRGSQHIIFSIPSINVKFIKVFLPNIGNCRKGTTFIRSMENVTITITCELLASYLQLGFVSYRPILRSYPKDLS